MDMNAALQEVLKTALIHHGLICGICKAAKALDKCQTHFLAFASNFDESMYVKLAEALYTEHQVNLIKVGGNKKLGNRSASVKLTRKRNPLKWLAAGVLWLRTVAKNHRSRMSSGNTSSTRKKKIHTRY